MRRRPEWFRWLCSLITEAKLTGKRERYALARYEEWTVPIDCAQVSPEAKIAVAELLGESRIRWNAVRGRR